MTRILIVGGGIAGASLSAEIAPHADVILAEAEPAFGVHASGRSAAMFAPGYGNAVIRELNAASAEALGKAGVLSPRPILWLGRPDQRELFEAEVAESGMTPIPVAEALGMVPILNAARVAFAAIDTGSADIDTDRLLQSCLSRARRAGAKTLTGARVTGLTRTAGGWRAETTRGTFPADVVVNAAGAWADDVARMAGLAPLGLQPLRRSMARLPAPAGHDVRAWPMIHPAGGGWYAKPDAGKWLVSPAEEDPMPPMDAWPDDMTLAHGLARYEEMVTVPVTRVEASWAGLRTFAPDRTPVVGSDPADSAFFWLAGQGGYGFQTAPALARVAAARIAGVACDLPARVLRAMDPARFR